MKRTSNRKTKREPDDTLCQLQRATAIGPLIAAGIQHAPPSLLDGLDGDLQQIRIRVAKTWPEHRLGIIKTAKKPWDGLASGTLLGTLKQRAEAQLGACAGFVQAAVEARDKGNGWHSLATMAAVSILRLHGAVDALEITRDTLTGPRAQRGIAGNRTKGLATKASLRAAAIAMKKANPRLSRTSAASNYAMRFPNVIQERQARRLITQVFSAEEWKTI